MATVIDKGRGGARFVLVTLAITGLYLLLQQIELRLADVAAPLVERRGDSDRAQEARRIVAQSAERESRLPAEWRAEVFRLGYQIGFSAERMGNVGLSDAGRQARNRAFLAAGLSAAASAAQKMGVAPADWPPVRNLQEFSEINARFEADETGIAGRIERQLTLRHRHLFLAGVHVGITHAALTDSAGELFNTYAYLAGRHAALAGLPATAWEPVMRPPQGTSAQEKLANFRSALAALDQAAAAPPSLP
jgi:hypothetical protein